jgi:hypothetical protein
MGLVDVYAFPSELWDKCLSNQGGNIVSEVHVISSILEKTESMHNANSEKLAQLKKELAVLNNMKEGAKESARSLARSSFADYADVHESNQLVKDVAIEILKTQRAIAEHDRVASKGAETLANVKDTYNKMKRGENISGLLNRCTSVQPMGKSTTNADGKFALDWTSSKNVQLNEVLSRKKGPQKVILFAKSSRIIGNSEEYYNWLVWLPVNEGESHIMLSNNNLYETNCSECVLHAP